MTLNRRKFIQEGLLGLGGILTVPARLQGGEEAARTTVDNLQATTSVEGAEPIKIPLKEVVFEVPKKNVPLEVKAIAGRGQGDEPDRTGPTLVTVTDLLLKPGVEGDWRSIESSDLTGTSAGVVKKGVWTLTEEDVLEDCGEVTATAIVFDVNGDEYHIPVVLKFTDADGEPLSKVDCDDLGKGNPEKEVTVPSRSFKLYPNPVDSECTLSWTGEDVDRKGFEIHSLLGQKVESFQHNSLGNEINFDVRDLSAGTYILIGRTAEGVRYSFKLIKR